MGLVSFSPLTSWGLILGAAFMAWFFWHQFIKEDV